MRDGNGRTMTENASEGIERLESIDDSGRAGMSAMGSLIAGYRFSLSDIG